MFRRLLPMHGKKKRPLVEASGLLSITSKLCDERRLLPAFDLLAARATLVSVPADRMVLDDLLATAVAPEGKQT